jgi:hypothetical protein
VLLHEGDPGPEVTPVESRVKSRQRLIGRKCIRCADGVAKDFSRTRDDPANLIKSRDD